MELFYHMVDMTKDNVEVSSKQDNKCFNDEGP